MLLHAQGLGPLLPVLLNGLMLGTPDVREQAASVLGELVGVSTADALKVLSCFLLFHLLFGLTLLIYFVRVMVLTLETLCRSRLLRKLWAR